MRIPLERFPCGYKKLRTSLLEILVLIFLHTEFLITENYNVDADRNTDNWMVEKSDQYSPLVNLSDERYYMRVKCLF